MMKVEAVIQPDRIMDAQRALEKVGLREMALLEIHDLGRHPSRQFCYRGSAFVVPSSQRVRLEFLVDEESLRRAIDAITAIADTGSDGRGRILVSQIDSLIHVHDESRASGGA